MGATRAVTDAAFEDEVLKSEKPVVVDYWAEWCGPCRQVSPVLEEIAGEHADKIDVVKLNVDENPVTSQKYRSLNLPTLSVFKGGGVTPPPPPILKTSTGAAWSHTIRACLQDRHRPGV